MTNRTCAIIPTFNHCQVLPETVARLRDLGLPVYVVDDGSGEPSASAITMLHNPAAGIVVHRRPANGGKGAAVIDGFRLALADGHTHALQVDADGQHDLDAVPALLAAAEQAPRTLVSGAPVFDASMPPARRIGRWITHVWVAIETLSPAIVDTMCGLRVYPLRETMRVIDDEGAGTGMDFDIEIMVRLCWRGVRPVTVPVRVTYPIGNTSNFSPLDHLRIAKMHVRLVTGLPLRIVRGLARRRQYVPDRVPAPRHWANTAERGGLRGVRFLGWVFRMLGQHACLALTIPIVTGFWLTGRDQRRASQAYLNRVLGHRPSPVSGLRHFIDFARRSLELMAAWTSAIPSDALVVGDPAVLERMTDGERGCVLVVAHHGNAPLSLALMPPALRDRMTILLHTRNAAHFNQVLREFQPDTAVRVVEVTEFGPDTAISLRERVDKGEWIAIAGDRVPVLSTGRTSMVPFLGTPAPFAHGPWLIAAVLEAPVYLLFCVRTGRGAWRLVIEPFAERVVLPRGARTEALARCTATYAQRLEAWCRMYPFQWYNFFDIWAPEASPCSQPR